MTALAVALAVAPAASAAKHACFKPSVVKGAKARLVVKDGSLFGCLRGSRRAIRVTDVDFGEGSFGYWRAPRLAGTFVAVEVHNDYKCSTVEVFIMDLRSRDGDYTPAGSYSFEDHVNSCAVIGREATDIVLRSDGAAAFIAGGTEVVRADGIDVVTLERGPQIGPTSLGLTRSGRVTWLSGGDLRSAVLPR